MIRTIDVPTSSTLKSETIDIIDNGILKEIVKNTEEELKMILDKLANDSSPRLIAYLGNSIDPTLEKPEKIFVTVSVTLHERSTLQVMEKEVNIENNEFPEPDNKQLLSAIDNLASTVAVLQILTADGRLVTKFWEIVPNYVSKEGYIGFEVCRMEFEPEMEPPIDTDHLVSSFEYSQ